MTAASDAPTLQMELHQKAQRVAQLESFLYAPPLVTAIVRHTACSRGNTTSHDTLAVSVVGLMGGSGKYSARSASASAVKVGSGQKLTR